jgi:hypothetical protein
MSRMVDAWSDLVRARGPFTVILGYCRFHVLCYLSHLASQGTQNVRIQQLAAL